MDDETAPVGTESTLRYLKWLVTTLTVTMIVGVLTITAILVMRFNAPIAVSLPDVITLPDGSSATAFTQGKDWLAVVTAEDEILIYDRTTAQLVQRIRIQMQDSGN